MRRLVFVTVAILAAAAVSFGSAQDAPKPAKPKRDERLSRETPEGTLRVFTLGIMLPNEQLIKITSLEIAPEEMALLLQDPFRDPQGNAMSGKEMKERAASFSVRRLKPGDKVVLPGGRVTVVQPDEVNDEHLVLVLEDSPIPTRLHKLNGAWWVDPGPIIAGRKRAAEMKAKREATGSKP